MFFYFGRDVLIKGIRTYIKKHAFGVASLQDFFEHMSNAAVQLGRTDTDLKKWAKSWLYSSGCSEIAPDCVIAIKVDPKDEEKTIRIVNSNDVNNLDSISKCKIKSFGVIQKIYSKNEDARLQSQKFKIALFDKDL
jgi:thymidylate kinase